MFKTFLKFALAVIIAQVVTYFVAGVIAQNILGANEFYPPSPNAISYLRDPHDLALVAWIIPVQALRGLLFALVLWPFRQRLLELGTWFGGLTIAGVIFVVGFVSASGGMIEHFLYFKAADYPVKFAMITFVEILIQTLLMGPAIVAADKRLGGKKALQPA
jgi:hypothetical protein